MASGESFTGLLTCFEKSPHAIRRFAVTDWLNEGQNNDHLSQRMDISTKTLDEHYDARSEEKRRRRQESFEIETRD
jgi:hypothetical protein